MCLAAAVALSAVPAAAEASHYSWVHNKRSSYVPGYWCQTGNCGVKEWMRNGTKYAMICWVDNRYSYTGNYSSRRWFYGQSFATGAGVWVHSSYVYYQKTVPRC